MKVSGFTIIRNGNKFDYPFREAILSILPLCDEFIVNVGTSDDGTLESVKSIQDPKLSIFESTWDMNLKDGKVLSEETNKAKKKCSGDWLFYIQSDEVLHEKYYDYVMNEMRKNLNNKTAEGLRFRYKHFYGSYDYYQDNYRKWYIRETRIIRNDPGIVSWGDAMDFRHTEGSKLNVKDINAEIYHYGWVRAPEKLLKKRKDFELMYNDGKTAEMNIASFRNYDDLGHLKKFKETHPKVMQRTVDNAKWGFDARLELQDPEFIRKLKIFLHPLTKRLLRLRRIRYDRN